MIKICRVTRSLTRLLSIPNFKYSFKKPSSFSKPSLRELNLNRNSNNQQTIDHFQISLNNERKAVFNILIELYSNLEDKNVFCFETYTTLIAEIYGCLRSKMFPKKRYRHFAHFLYNASRNLASQKIYLRAILASPTAIKELPIFLNYANIYKNVGFSLDLKFLMVRWECLNEARSIEQSTLDSIYRDQQKEVKETLIAKGWTDAQVIPVDVNLDYATGEVITPFDFRACYHEVMSARKTLHSNKSRLNNDVVWIEQFYRQQNSLKSFDVEQAFLDLVIRKAVGNRITEEYSTFSESDNHYYMMLTSELNGRFLRCYDTIATIHNLSLANK